MFFAGNTYHERSGAYYRAGSFVCSKPMKLVLCVRRMCPYGPDGT
jgi:hypothetical protein